MRKYIIELAIKEAQKSQYIQRLGCVIFDKKIILSKGHNYACKSALKLHPKFTRWPGSIHAEVDAILKAKKDLCNTSLLVIRISKTGQFLLAKPCKWCSMYIEHVKIKNIFYSIPVYPYIVNAG